MKPCASRDLGGDAFRRDPLLLGGTAHHATVEVQAPPVGKAGVLRPLLALFAQSQVELWKFVAREPPEQASAPRRSDDGASRKQPDRDPMALHHHVPFAK